MTLSCPHCGRKDFLGPRGLNHHLATSRRCKAAEQNAHGGRRTRAQARVEEKEEATAPQQVVQPARRVTRRSAIQATAQTLLEEHDADDEEALKGSKDNPNGSFLQHEDEEESSDEEIGDVDDQDGQDADDQSDEGIGQMVDDDDQSDDGMGLLQHPSEDEEDEDDEQEEETDDELTELVGSTAPNTSILARFKEFAPTGKFVTLLEPREITGIKLMRVLKTKKAPLNAYQDIFEWHLQEKGFLREGLSMRDAAERKMFIGREPLLKSLSSRCGLTGREAEVKVVTLPSSREVVRIPCNKAEDCMLQLLTDPRITDDHYFFFDDDPTAPPPDSTDHLADMPTGSAFRDTYKKLCTGPNGGQKKQLMGVIFYLDAAVTGQFADLPVLILKMSLSIFSRQARHKEYCWANLAYLPHVKVAESRGRKMMKESNHLEAANINVLPGEGGIPVTDQVEETPDDDEPRPIPHQDFHKMIDVALESYVELQKTGFIWDLRYKKKTYEGIWYELFTPFVKCDTEEADVLCGKYKPKTERIQQLCRYCLCPNKHTGKFSLRYNFKTKEMIKKLVDKKDLNKLQKISQHCLTNAWYKIRFNLANDRSIHGATPFEKLHQIDLGVFPRIRDVFFKMTGESGDLFLNINGLGSLYGKLYSHQSDRTMPPTNFGNGIKSGKLMAREHKGVMLVLATILMSTKGRELLGNKRHFRKNASKDDWLMLTELLLQWEVFLNEGKMERSVVLRLKKKHKYIMYLIKKVARRTEGMGMRFVKFHGILHMMEDILLYGVPMEMDTGANEGHHKSSKQAAHVTQRDRSTFDIQVAKRLFEYLLLDLASYELETGRVNWAYYHDFDPDQAQEFSLGSDSSSLGMEEIGQSMQSMDITGQHDSSRSSFSRPFSVSSNPSSIHSTHSSASSHHSPQSTTNQDVSMGQSGEEQRPNGEEKLPETEEEQANQVSSFTGGTPIQVWKEEDEDGTITNQYEILTRGKYKAATKLNKQLMKFLIDLQDVVVDHLPYDTIPIYTYHARKHAKGSDMWHAHPNYRGKGPWKDWALVDWGDEGVLPCHIQCFVDLEDFRKQGRVVVFGGVRLEAATYAVVESSQYEDDDEERRQSELFVPILKDVDTIQNNRVKKRMFYLANVEAITDVACVVPDIGGPPNRYFFVHPRPYWSKLFVRWVKEPHGYDEMSDESNSGEE